MNKEKKIKEIKEALKERNNCVKLEGKMKEKVLPFLSNGALRCISNDIDLDIWNFEEDFKFWENEFKNCQNAITKGTIKGLKKALKNPKIKKLLKNRKLAFHDVTKRGLK